MGLSEVVKTLILVKADTSDAKAQLRSLRGEEKKAAQERLSETEKANRSIEDQIRSFTKATATIGAVVVAYKAAQAAAKAYLEDVRLEASAAGADLDRLKAATHGLVEADTLLSFAGKAMNGTWRLTQQEMETVLQGAMALRKTMGVELQPTVEALTEAIAKGNTKALREFGIEAKDKKGVLEELRSGYARLGGDVTLAGDAF
jgi:hypothetical protein